MSKQATTPNEFTAGYSVQLNEAQTSDLIETADMYGVPSAEFGSFALIFGLATLQQMWKRAAPSGQETPEIITWPDGSTSKVIRHPDGNVSLVEIQPGEAHEDE